MKLDIYREFRPGNSIIVGSKTKTETKRLHHLDETEVTVWAFIVIILLATIVAGYMFWLHVGN